MKQGGLHASRRTLQLALNRPTVHLKTRSSPDMSTRTRRAEAHDHTDNSRRDALWDTRSFNTVLEMSCFKREGKCDSGDAALCFHSRQHRDGTVPELTKHCVVHVWPPVTYQQG